jgi:hypothetical protein
LNLSQRKLLARSASFDVALLGKKVVFAPVKHKKNSSNEASLSRLRAVGLVYPHFGWLRELLIALKLSNQFMDVAKATEL